jgi:hypothetical protein
MAKDDINRVNLFRVRESDVRFGGYEIAMMQVRC